MSVRVQVHADTRVCMGVGAGVCMPAHACMCLWMRVCACTHKHTPCVCSPFGHRRVSRVFTPTRALARLPGLGVSAPASPVAVLLQVSVSRLSAFKTLAVSSRKLRLCGSEVPRAAWPSYWLIGDPILRGSPVIPRNARYFLLLPTSPPAPLPPPHWGLSSRTVLERSTCGVGCGISGCRASQHARPFVNLDTTIMCAEMLKGPFRIFLPLKNNSFLPSRVPGPLAPQL